jgi:hypothetical protein
MSGVATRVGHLQRSKFMTDNSGTAPPLSPAAGSRYITLTRVPHPTSRVTSCVPPTRSRNSSSAMRNTGAASAISLTQADPDIPDGCQHLRAPKRAPAVDRDPSGRRNEQGDAVDHRKTLSKPAEVTDPVPTTKVGCHPLRILRAAPCPPVPPFARNRVAGGPGGEDIVTDVLRQWLRTGSPTHVARWKRWMARDSRPRATGRHNGSRISWPCCRSARRLQHCLVRSVHHPLLQRPRSGSSGQRGGRG